MLLLIISRLNDQFCLSLPQNVFRITLDFATNDIIIKTGVVMSTDGIVGITGGVKTDGTQFGHHHVDFSSDENAAGVCKVPQ